MYVLNVTCISTVGFITLIHTINDAIAAVGVRSTVSFITLKGIVTTVVIRWWNRIILDAVPLISLQFHAKRTATYTIKRRSWETEVAALPIGRLGATAGQCC